MKEYDNAFNEQEKNHHEIHEPEEGTEIEETTEVEEIDLGMNGFSSKTLFMIATLQLSVLVVALVWGVFKNIHWWEKIHLNTDIITGIIIGLFIVSLNHIVYLKGRKFDFTNMEWIFKNLYYPVFSGIKFREILVVSILSGFCEEAFFRGVLQQEWGIAISSIIFGLLHTGSRRLIFMGIWTGIIGSILGYVFQISGNLIVPVIAHGLNNFIGLIYLRYYYKEEKISVSGEGHNER